MTEPHDLPTLAAVRFTALDLADYGDPGKPLPDHVRKAVEQAMTRVGFEMLEGYGFPARDDDDPTDAEMAQINPFAL